MAIKAFVPINQMNFEVEAESPKDLFREVATLWEHLGEKSCGLCKSEAIRPIVREVSDGKKGTIEYFEMACTHCGARLAFGQHMGSETLFPKRKLNKDGQPDMEAGEFGPHRGWYKWKPQDKPTDAAQGEQSSQKRR